MTICSAERIAEGENEETERRATSPAGSIWPVGESGRAEDDSKPGAKAEHKAEDILVICPASLSKEMPNAANWPSGNVKAVLDKR